MAFQITNEWLIDIPLDFEHRVDEGKLVFWQTGITIIAVAFHMPETTGKIELLNQIQKKMPEDVLETFVSTRGEIVALGYSQIQPSPEGKKRLSLYTFTASDTSCLQVAYYLDDPEDLDWAKSLWEGIIFIPQEQL